MTLRNPPTFLQAGQHPAENTRLALSGLLGSPQGVFSGGVISDSVADGDPGHGRVLPGDFKVTENGTPNMSVNVAAGAAWIRGTESATQGSYHVVSDDTVNLVIDAADATNSRRDLVVLQVKDADYSGADNEVVLEVVKGTAAGSPVDPAVPDNALVLARVTVTAAATSITTSDIADFAITPVGFRFAGRVVFTAGGTFTKADYPWLRAVNVKAVGGGGGGGGAGNAAAGNASMGAGGGGGGYVEKLVLAPDLPSSVTVTVGAGGAGGSGANNGSAGSTSSFGSLCSAGGGSGGAQVTSSGSFAATGGDPGSGTGGDLNVTGSTGSVARGLDGTIAELGVGGGSALGGSQRSGASGAGANGLNGNSYGGGGSGGFNRALQSTNRSGGAGAPGVVIVDLYA